MYFKDAQTGQIFRVNGNTNSIELVSSLPPNTPLSQGQTMNQIANQYGVSMPGGATPTQTTGPTTTAPIYSGAPVFNNPTPTPSTAGPSSSGPATNTSDATLGIDTSGLSPDQQATFGTYAQWLQQMINTGNMINPALQITPKTTADFLSAATDQIHPYYATQLSAAIDQLKTSFANDSTTLSNNENAAENTYGRNLKTLQGNEADNGFALSGIRNTDEQNLATDTQNSLNSARQSFGTTANNNVLSFANRFGGNAAMGLNLTAPTPAPRVVAGENSFDKTGGTTPLYTLSPSVYSGLIGSDQNAETSATNSLASGLASNANAVAGSRSLTALTQ